MAKVAKVLNPGVQKVSRDPPIPLVPPALYNEYLKGCSKSTELTENRMVLILIWADRLIPQLHFLSHC